MSNLVKYGELVPSPEASYSLSAEAYFQGINKVDLPDISCSCRSREKGVGSVLDYFDLKQCRQFLLYDEISQRIRKVVRTVLRCKNCHKTWPVTQTKFVSPDEVADSNLRGVRIPRAPVINPELISYDRNRSYGLEYIISPFEVGMPFYPVLISEGVNGVWSEPVLVEIPSSFPIGLLEGENNPHPLIEGVIPSANLDLLRESTQLDESQVDEYQVDEYHERYLKALEDIADQEIEVFVKNSFGPDKINYKVLVESEITEIHRQTMLAYNFQPTEFWIYNFRNAMNPSTYFDIDYRGFKIARRGSGLTGQVYLPMHYSSDYILKPPEDWALYYPERKLLDRPKSISLNNDPFRKELKNG